MLSAGRLVVLPLLCGALWLAKRTCCVCAWCIVRWQLHICSDMNISLRCVQSQPPIARFTSGMYVGHEVSSCGRLARRKSGRLLVVFNCLLVASWKTIMHSAYAQFAVRIGRCCAIHGGANSILTGFLPFGLRSSPALFNRVADGIEACVDIMAPRILCTTSTIL